ncbi:helix-turn-helix domain-containing protein [Deinococcus fonticola]|uniref:helix-turn-helix domain-containing protein n=1 Tax=Deinococcus fonticola TaxID=2528713 RepID=UPI001074B0C4
MTSSSANLDESLHSPESATESQYPLRASILRLHRTGMTVQQLSAHFDRNHQAIHNDLTRFEQHGLAGLADQAPRPRPTRFTFRAQG